MLSQEVDEIYKLSFRDAPLLTAWLSQFLFPPTFHSAFCFNFVYKAKNEDDLNLLSCGRTLLALFSAKNA